MNQLVATLVSSSFTAAVIFTVAQYLRDRRTNKAKGAVAEQTVTTDVDAAKLANMDRRLSLVEKAHDEETEALNATIKNLKERLEAALARIDLLEKRVRFEDARYRAALRYIHDLRTWINQHLPGGSPPPIPPALEAEFDDFEPTNGNF